MAFRPATGFVIGLLVLAAICRVQAETPRARVRRIGETPLLITDQESYAVYAEVIGRTAGDKPLRLSQETTARSSLPNCDISGRWEPEWRPVVANFIDGQPIVVHCAA